jgi:hypothetical protein
MLKHTLVLVGLFFFGCGGASANHQVVKSAASRWQCPADQIEVKKLSGDMYRVAGCNQEADYACPDEATRPNGQCMRVSGT